MSEATGTARKRRIYVASSWRNEYQPYVVTLLRVAGHEVYDFRNPTVGYENPVKDVPEHKFAWSDIDAAWKDWSVNEYLKGLQHPIAQAAFQSDWQAMLWADTCVMVMPCGRSAALEAGYFTGALTEGTIGLPKELFIFLPKYVSFEPELMFLMSHKICVGEDDLFLTLKLK